MVRDLVVSLSPDAAADAVIQAITHEKTRFLIDTPPGILLDDYRVDLSPGRVVSLIFTKFFARIGSFVTLVVCIVGGHDHTVVHLATGGHKMVDRERGDDLGASNFFLELAESALHEHLSCQARHSVQDL